MYAFKLYAFITKNSAGLFSRRVGYRLIFIVGQQTLKKNNNDLEMLIFFGKTGFQPKMLNR